LDSEIFEDCYKSYLNNFDDGRSWKVLAEEYGYQSGESIRASFKRQRKANGMPSKNKIQEVNQPVKRKSPKILIFDIENSYTEIAAWGINKQYINKTQILHDWFILSFSCKYLYDDEIYSFVLTPEEAIAKDDKRVVGELWRFLDDCDIAITYNGNFHDIPKTNTRMLINKFPPPSPYKSIDVYQVISRIFGFTNKSMDYVSYMLDLERKMENEGMELWKKCVAGDLESLKKMENYNRQDVVCLQEDYIRIRPWIKNHPNIGLWHDSEERVCGYCGSKDITYSDKLTSTPSGLYKIFRCNDCDGIGRTKENILTKEKRKVLGTNV
jgi:DNA polymerase elongation subunit (family B)